MEMEQTSFNGREMPYSQEAEMAVLGSLLKGSDALGQAVSALRREDFYMRAHQEIFGAAQELFNLNTAVDAVTISKQLGSKLPAVGGIEYLAHLGQALGTTANLPEYVRIVRGLSLSRKLIAASQTISDKCYAGDEDPEDILDQAEQAIFEIADNRSSAGLVHVSEGVKDAVSAMEEAKKAQGGVVGIPTGFAQLDEMTSGMHNGQLIFIAARPGMGKTAFALNIATYCAIQKDVPVAVFSLEMSKSELVSRMIAGEGMIDGKKLQTGNLEAPDISRVASAIGRMVKAPIYMSDTPGITISEIRAQCRRMKLRHGLGLVVIDYLQLMQSPDRSTNRVEEVSKLTRSLKILAKELDVPVIVLSQLSRGPESRTDKRPMLSDLRESGSIEQDADVVMLLYREDYYNKETDRQNIAECNLIKNRRGRTQNIELAWRAEFTRFMNLDKRPGE